MPHRSLAFALAALAATVLPPPALAKSRPAVVDPRTLSDDYRRGLSEVSARLAAGDNAGAASKALALLGRASTPYEKYLGGQLLMQASAQRNDLAGQRKALTAMLDWQLTPAGARAEMRGKAGLLSAMLGDNKDAMAQIAYAAEQGYRSVPTQIALADAQFKGGNLAGGLAALDGAIALQTAAGKPVPQAWYDRALSFAVQKKSAADVAAWSARKIAAYPTPGNWRSAVVTYQMVAGGETQRDLDLYRLLAAADALASDRDAARYAALAAQAGSHAEAKAVVEAAHVDVQALGRDAVMAKEAAALAGLAPRAAKQLAGLAAREAKARAAADGDAALALADDYFATSQFAKAIDFYTLAAGKGGVDAGRVATRGAIARLRAGDLAGGQAALATVPPGPWRDVAALWSAWARDKQARNPG
jgi:hypothetical protein